MRAQFIRPPCQPIRYGRPQIKTYPAPPREATPARDKFPIFLQFQFFDHTGASHHLHCRWIAPSVVDEIPMTNEIPIHDHEPCVLIEGPRWGDAEFFGRWLLAADKANKLWNEAAKDPTFDKQVERLQVVYKLDLCMAALALLLELHEHFVAFPLRLDSEEGELFAILAEMGFFALTGERYQMVIPRRLNIARVKRALL